MTDTRKLLERQAAWQKGRAALTWPEKVRMAESVREWAAKFRRTRPPTTDGVSASRDPETGEIQAPRSE
ncbi:MAG TPA: hypothetical protein VG204_07235 [Terriglobia bacterium]|nr:hypothetical protein [Terriglobia bacterium]